MELTDLPVGNMHRDFNRDGDFDFNGFPADCSSASVSGSSYASSSFSPQTPISHPSTPPLANSLDFGSSFGSSADAIPFDLTPPSSATSPRFPMALKAEGTASGFVPACFASSSSRGQHGFSSHALASYGTQLTPSDTLDCGFFVNEAGAHSLFSISSSLIQTDQSWGKPITHWPHADGLMSVNGGPSPLRNPSAVQSIRSEAGDEKMPPFLLSAAARKQARFEEARHVTTALHGAQQRSPPIAARPHAKTKKQIGRFATRSGDMTMDSAQAGKFRCPYDGCKTGPYRRKEHLKRHIHS